MTKRDSTPPPPDEGGAPDVDLDALGFDLDSSEAGWLDQLRAAEAPQELGSIGEYELVREVSRGGQGVVFQARQPGTNRLIAIKRLLAGSFSTATMRLRFEREVEAASALNHPNIVTVYGMETVDGLPLLAMEWIEGVPATRWATGAGDDEGAAPPARDPDEVLELFLRIADAVQHAHARGIVHRDLKPTNILVDGDGQPHVLDFGLAKRFESDGECADATALTLSSDFLGTPAYASPEQLRAKSERVDRRTDVYSLGVLLYEMLTGRSPYPGRSSLADLIDAIENQTPARPSSLDPRLGRELDTIVLKALAKEQTERYATVEALAFDVRSYLVGEPIRAMPPSSWYLFRKLVNRNRAVSGLVAVLFVATVGDAIYFQWQSRELEKKVQELEQQRAATYEAGLQANTDAAKLLKDFMPPCLLDPQSTVNPFYEEDGRDYEVFDWDSFDESE